MTTTLRQDGIAVILRLIDRISSAAAAAAAASNHDFLFAAGKESNKLL